MPKLLHLLSLMVSTSVRNFWMTSAYRCWHEHKLYVVPPIIVFVREPNVFDALLMQIEKSLLKKSLGDHNNCNSVRLWNYSDFAIRFKKFQVGNSTVFVRLNGSTISNFEIRLSDSKSGGPKIESNKFHSNRFAFYIFGLLYWIRHFEFEKFCNLDSKFQSYYQSCFMKEK